MPNLIEQRVAEAHAGENPTVLCQMLCGWAVIGNQQFIPGYCLLLADPVVPDLNSLAAAQCAGMDGVQQGSILFAPV